MLAPPPDAPVLSRSLPLVLGLLAALAPLSIDMYLPAFPSLARDLGADPASVQLTLAAYFLGMAAGQVVHGPLSDRYGRRPLLLIGMGVYVAASLACALAGGVGMLIGLRLVQALGGCAGIVLGRAVIRDVAEGAAAVRLLSLLMLTMGLAPIVAPVLGGWLATGLGWRAIFWGLSAVGVLALVVVTVALPESLPAERRRHDTFAGILRVYGGLLRDRRYMGYALGGSIGIGGMFAYIAGSPFVFMVLHGVTPQGYGALFGMNAAGLIAASQVNGRLARRYAPEAVLAVVQWIAAAAGLVLLGAAVTGVGGLPALVAPLFVYVSTLGFVMPLATALAMAPHARTAGSASALLGAMQFGFGAVTGALVGALDNGTPTAMGLVVAGCGVGALLVRRGLAGGR